MREPLVKIKHVLLQSSKEAKVYLISKVFENDVKLRWKVFLLRRKAINFGINLANLHGVKFIIDLKGGEHDK